ncbi:glycoside hydrolase family 26 protein [Streptomyces sp. NPDC101175]|uniref:glycoside hydrolase family 26 protein n=1 Tax=Streptomyces sp. NPDC101175 TaxID=3366123 RepID=UPI003832BB9F
MAPRGTRRRSAALFTFVLGLVLLAGPGCVPGGEPPPRPVRAAPVDPSGPSTAYGAYVGYGPEAVRRVAEFGAWLGRSEPRVGHAYLPGDTWAGIEGATGDLEQWAAWRRDRQDRLLVLNVPMLDRSEAHLSDDVVRAELGDGAGGRYDDHFLALARRLVDLGVPDTEIVLGWEMNGTTYTHRCAPDPTSWKRYWARIVTAMRSVPGQRFRFDFTPNRGHDAIPWPDCYPGDAYVDVIGMDAYDAPRGLSFTDQLTEPYGLLAQVDFARAHHKPIAYPEWGLFDNGDNPTYMGGMLTWMAAQHPLYQTISDYCPHGVWRCRANPKSAAVYRALTDRLS